MRYARKTDSTQPQIVSGLRAIGVKVWIIHEPCDLLCYLWSNDLKRFIWRTLEVKPLVGKKPKARIRSDQPEQQEFLRETQTPVVTSFEEARRALGLCGD